MDRLMSATVPMSPAQRFYAERLDADNLADWVNHMIPARMQPPPGRA
jgi:hypothetical protein